LNFFFEIFNLVFENYSCHVSRQYCTTCQVKVTRVKSLSESQFGPYICYFYFPFFKIFLNIFILTFYKIVLKFYI